MRAVFRTMYIMTRDSQHIARIYDFLTIAGAVLQQKFHPPHLEQIKGDKFLN